MTDLRQRLQARRERENPIKSANCGTIGLQKYESRSAALTAPGVTPERLLLMCSQSNPNSTTESIQYGYCHCGCGNKTPLAKATHKRSGLVKGKPVRYLNGHHNHRPWVAEWSESHGCYLVPLTCGKFAKVDEEDLPLISGRSWSWQNKGVAHTGYAATVSERPIRRSLRMHRVILGVDDPRVFVDHVNGDGLDNRRHNLRIATNSQNQANRRRLSPHKSSKYRGVSWIKSRKKWAASIKAEGKAYFLGYFEREADAAVAYNDAAADLFKGFSLLNKVGGTESGDSHD